MTAGNNDSSIRVGIARGWNVWPLESGDWAWSAWAGESLGLQRSGIEDSEARAQETALRELEVIVAEARMASQQRRQLTVRDGDAQDDDGISRIAKATDTGPC